MPSASPPTAPPSSGNDKTNVAESLRSWWCHTNNLRSLTTYGAEPHSKSSNLCLCLPSSGSKQLRIPQSPFASIPLPFSAAQLQPATGIQMFQKAKPAQVEQYGVPPLQTTQLWRPSECYRNVSPRHKPKENVFLFSISQIREAWQAAPWANPSQSVASCQRGSPLMQGHEEDVWLMFWRHLGNPKASKSRVILPLAVRFPPSSLKHSPALQSLFLWKVCIQKEEVAEIFVCLTTVTVLGQQHLHKIILIFYDDL